MNFLIILLILSFHIIKTNCQDKEKLTDGESKKLSPGQLFSGLYLPDVTYNAEHYAGSWLTSRKRFMSTKRNIMGIGNLEGGSFSMISSGTMLMTRDFFDFQVIHLSSTTNNLPSSDEKLLKALGDNMERNALELATAASNSKRLRREHRNHNHNRTVVLIPFSSIPGSHDVGNNLTPLKIFTNKVRSNFFIATFWSIHRYFQNIVVVVSTKEDYNLAKSLSLPYFELVDLSEDFTKNNYNKHLLPRETLKYGIRKFELASNSLLIDDQKWKRFRYVYFSESDHILIMRHVFNIFGAIDRTNGTIALAPHRMQTIALPQAYPEVIDVWNQGFRNKLKDVDLVNEYLLPKGSCCDNGRFVFKNCGGWWYNCEKWGLSNYTTWIRFGKFGWTLPLATEHQARCTYSKEKILCPVPDTCTSRAITPNKEFCKEIPNIEKTYEL